MFVQYGYRAAIDEKARLERDCRGTGRVWFLVVFYCTNVQSVITIEILRSSNIHMEIKIIIM